MKYGYIEEWVLCERIRPALNSIQIMLQGNGLKVYGAHQKEAKLYMPPRLCDSIKKALTGNSRCRAIRQPNIRATIVVNIDYEQLWFLLRVISASLSLF